MRSRKPVKVNTLAAVLCLVMLFSMTITASAMQIYVKPSGWQTYYFGGRANRPD